MAFAMDGADLVFLDPDNGLEGERLTPKSTALAELAALRRPNRALLLYHHQTRLPGGAGAEFAQISRRLGEVGFTSTQAVRLRPYSSRFYFLLDADSIIRERMAHFAETWGGEVEFFRPMRDA
jgi:hypothetical protein